MLRDIDMVNLLFTFIDPNLANNLTNLAEIIGLWGCFFQLQGPLVLGGARLPPSVKWSDGQDCRGKVKGQGLVEHCSETFRARDLKF